MGQIGKAPEEVLPVITGDPPSVLSAGLPGYYGFGERAARMAQMTMPALICGVELVWRVRRGRRLTGPGEIRNSLGIVEAAAAGVCLKALYNFFFVLAWAQGQWYYAVSVAVANIVLVIWVDRLVTREALLIRREWRGPWLVAHALLVLLSFNIFISRRNVEGPAAEVVLLRDPSPLKQELTKLGADRLIEYGDGFTSFVAERPALAGLGLALDASAARALREGRFLDLAYQRGYRIVVTHGAYAANIDEAVQDR